MTIEKKKNTFVRVKLATISIPYGARIKVKLYILIFFENISAQHFT